MNLSREDHIQRLRDLGECLKNRDDVTIEQQVRKIMAGQPAYWFRGRTSGATWVVELSACDEHNHSFLKALEAFVERHPGVTVLEILDGVIPLNAEAVHELQLCYRLQSSFRDNLADRERKAIFDPEFYPRMDPEMRARWAAEYEVIQRRWDARHAGVSPKAALVLAMTAVAADDEARVAVAGEQIEQVA